MEQYELYQKADEIVSKFKDGKERFHKSPTFHRVVQMLARGADPIDVIDQLITITDDTQRAFEQYIITDNRPMYINR